MDDNASAGQPISEAEALERLEQRDDPSQRYYAAWWLGRMRCQNPKAISLLIDALSSVLGQPASPDDLMVARNAARALGKLQAPAALASLLQALEHSDHDLREAAARSLGESGDANALPTLLETLNRSTMEPSAASQARLDQPCEALLEAIGCLAKGSEDPSICQALQRFCQHPRPMVQSAACRALVLVSGDSQWAAGMLNLLNDPEPLIRRGAVLDLGASGWRDAAEAIAGCAAESNIKLLALRQLLEQPLHGPAPSALGSQERHLLNLMDGVL